MANKGQLTGMLGVYLVAAELSRLGFIVSPTSRSAAGADLLVTDQSCDTTWSVQVKTNSGKATYWLMGAHARKMSSKSHIYVFVNNAAGKEPEFIVALSSYVAAKIDSEVSPTGNEWFWFNASDRPTQNAGWEQFGNPRPDPDLSNALQVEFQVAAASDPSL